MYDLLKKKKQLSPPAIDYYTTGHHNGRREGGLRCKKSFTDKSEKDKPLVSIITVVCNGAKHLEHAIESVLHQTYQNIEYIIIDGGSTDGTLDIIRKYDDQIAYWLSEPDEGISDAFNKGISMSSGDIIGIINADDWYEPGTVEKVIKRFLECKPDILHGIVRRGDELIIPDEAMLRYEMSINHPTVFVTRLSYIKLGLFRNDFRCAMDYEWMLRAKESGLSFLYINQCLAHMRLGGVSDRQWRTVICDFLKAQNMHYPDRLVSNLLFFIFQVTKGTASRLFEKVGLNGLVRFYHTYGSIVKKRKTGLSNRDA